MYRETAPLPSVKLPGTGKTIEVRGKTRTRERKPGKPKPLEGRKIVHEEPTEWGWLRQELVPCRNPRCRKDPDHHGPYWYSYRLLNRRWIMTYHGKERPALEGKISLADAEDRVRRLSRRMTLDKNDLDRLSRIVTDLSNETNAAVLRVRTQAGALISREYERRDADLRDRVRSLTAKKDRGETLTPDEERSLDHALRAFEGDH